MAGFGVANERLRALEELEREIGASLQSAGVSLCAQVATDQPHEGLGCPRWGLGGIWEFRGVPGGIWGFPSAFLLAQVATGQPHEGSSYAARKSCQLALNRLDYARRRLAELARACELMLE
ncbi:MED11 polymerase, partial [Rhagologus leucostigma]|nr:MED11 polymerase [Rhagologus leucostigma]